MEIKRTPAGRSFILCLSPVCFFFLSILLQGLPCGSSGQILVVAWRILSEMLCRSFIVLRRSMVGHTLYFTREHTARWVQKCGVPVTARNTTFMLSSQLQLLCSCVTLLLFTQALNDAKRELRYLLVYLHGEDHQDTDQFCRYGTYYLLPTSPDSCLSLSRCSLLWGA